ncbi:MAG: ornithine carbamoyltransferase, partial [Halobacteriaceae archaeon]
GDGNNVAHSLMQICDILDISLNIATPSGYEPDEQIQQRVSDSNVTILHDPQRAVHGAQAVYTDVYVSMGEEADESETKRQHFEDYTVDKELMESAASEAVFMHCLPAHRGQEVTEDVIDGPRSIVFDQAENRLHVQKAIMYTLMTE